MCCPCSTACSSRCTLPCEVLVVVDFPEDTTMPAVQGVRRGATRGAHRGQPVRARAGLRDPVRHPPAAAPGRRRHDGRRLRRPAPDRRAHPAGRARRRRRGRVALHAGRPAGRRPAVQAVPLARRGPHAVLVRPGRHPRRDELVQGLLPRLRRRVGIESQRRLRDRPRAHREGAADAPARRRDPDHLARPAGRRLELQGGQVAARSTCAGTASRSGRAWTSRSSTEGATRSPTPHQE